MPHCVFMHKADSIYDDVPAKRYQFPKAYLARAEQCVGDWIVYLEPTKVRGSRGYFAVARVEAIIPDVLVKGKDWAHHVVGREVVEAAGGRVELAEMVPGHSTTHIIERILAAQDTK